MVFTRLFIQEHTIHNADLTLKEVQRILGFAKLDGTDLKPSVQCLNFIPNLDNEAMILVELDEDLTGQLQAGDSLVLRGLKSDSAVLCSKNKTFDLKEAETSNTLLLVQDYMDGSSLQDTGEPSIIHKHVCGLKHEYYELKPVKPRLKRLKSLLEENLYNGRECEEDENHMGRKYTFNELLDEIQASEDELFAGLQSLEACVVQGNWRMFDLDLIGKVLESIITLVDEQSWTTNSIPCTICCEHLSDQYLRFVTKHVLETYGESVKPSELQESMEVDDGLYRLSEDKICRYYGELILRQSKEFNLAEFKEVWQMSVPEGFITTPQQLEGLALIDLNTKPARIRYYPVIELPEDISERFHALFLTKEKWSLDEITPYIKDLTTAKLGVGAILTKYARASTLKGIKVYGSKM